MKKIIFLLLVTSGMLFAAGKPLIANGRSEGVIVIPAEPDPVEQFAAQELQTYLRKITGVTLPVVKGKTAARTGYRLGRATGIRFAGDTPPDSWRSQLKNGFLEIAGADGPGEETDTRNPAGTLFGVYAYLQDSLGVRWLWPGEDGEYIPHKTELSLSAMKPSQFRHQLKTAGPNLKVKDPELFRWYRRTMNYRENLREIHAGKLQGHAFVFWPEKYGKQHPEWFALIKGVRNTNKRTTLCVSNPELQDEIVRCWNEIQSKSKRPLAVNIKENDYQMRCECEKCRSWDGPDKRGPTARYFRYKNVSERYCRFAMEVWKRASKLRPDAQVSFFAYHGNVYAPRKVKLNEHCLVALVPDLPFPRTPEHTKFLRQEYDQWKASGAQLILRPNYFLGGYLMPEIWYDEFADEFQYLCKLGLTGFRFDGNTGSFAVNGLNRYVMARLAVDPTLNAEALKEEYVTGFGPAAPAVSEYFDFWHQYTKDNAQRINDIWLHTRSQWYFHGCLYAEWCYKIFPEQVLVQGRAMLDKAARLAATDKDAAKKVAFLRIGLEHAILASHTSALFADRKVSRQEKWEALKRLRDFRTKLPPFTSYAPKLRWIAEKRWKIDGVSLRDMSNVPIDPGVKAYEEAER